jgi:hypothetical protein
MQRLCDGLRLVEATIKFGFADDQAGCAESTLLAVMEKPVWIA